MLTTRFLEAARFWSKVDVADGNAACWEWRGAFHGNGYGNYRIPGPYRENVQAHRFAYKLANGDYPEEGLVVRHKCDNPRCVNPFHLEAGTKADNYQDMVNRRASQPA